MLLAPRPATTAADLLRVLAVWLVLVLLLQGFAAVCARVAGPRHLHQAQSALMLLQHRQQQQQHHHHDVQRHHHAGADDSVVTPAEAAALDEALDAAAAALAAAFGLLATVCVLRAMGRARPVWCAALAEAWRTAWLGLLLKPPQRG